MIPIIYAKNETAFTSNGLGRLTDCISCIVREERNGTYELEITYPVNGKNFSKIINGRIISCTHDETRTKQPFVIYRITKPINGICTVNAHHVSYALSNVVMPPFEATTVAEAFDYIERFSMTKNDFVFWTDKTSSGTLKTEVPKAVRSILLGSEGSVLDSFGGGDFEFDKKTVKLYQDRGTDSGVTIRYGKNLTDLKQELDTLNSYNSVVPYWKGGEDEVIVGGVIIGTGATAGSSVITNQSDVALTDHNGNELTAYLYNTVAIPLDLSNEFDDPPTVLQLQTKAQTILESNKPWQTKENIKVDFVALWQTEEYKDVAILERVRLCDTVTVYYPELDVNVKKKVVKTDYNVLLDKYDSIELGDKTTSFADVIEQNTAIVATQTIEETKSDLEYAIEHVTDLITGGLGGHVVMRCDAEGKPQEILIMDTENEMTAVQVLRININGIGFSSNGINGPFRTGWTLDGQFVADFITAGTLSANRIKGGILTLGGRDDANGIIVMYDNSGNQIGKWSRAGLVASGDLELSDGTRLTKITTDDYQIPSPQSGNNSYYYNVQISGLETWLKNHTGKIVDGIEYNSNTNLQRPMRLTFGWQGADSINLTQSYPFYHPIEQDEVQYANHKFYHQRYLESKVFDKLLCDTGNGVMVSYGVYSTDLKPYFCVYELSPSIGDPEIIKSVGKALYLDYHTSFSAHYLYSATVSNAKAVYVAYDGTLGVTSSSQRWKNSIRRLTEEKNECIKSDVLESVRAIPVSVFKYNEGHFNFDYDYDQYELGLIAEDVYEQMPSATVRSADDPELVDDWSIRELFPAVMLLAQEAMDRAEKLEAKIEQMEARINKLEEMLCKYMN